MTEPTRVDFPSAGGLNVAAYRWDPEGAPRAIAQIVHGVGEYARRYSPLADALVHAGYVVYAHDNRGHGKTAVGENHLGELGEGGWAELVADIGRMGERARADFPGRPLGLIGHSLGSFAAQQYLLDNSATVSAVVLSGTAVLDLLEPMMDLDSPMDLSGFNVPFQPSRTDFDWLSRDEAQVDEYMADPLCGFGLDTAGSKEMFVAARQLADGSRVSQMRSDLPVHIVVGDQDPVNGGLALVTELVRRYQAAGLTDVTLVNYPGARHEVFNELNRDEVVDSMIAWLAKALRL